MKKIINRIRYYKNHNRLKSIIKLLGTLNITNQDCLNGNKFIEINNSTKLFGNLPSEDDALLYEVIKHRLPYIIDIEYFSIARQAMTSFLYPTSMPTLSMPFTSRVTNKFGQRYNDYVMNLPYDAITKEKLNELFRPKLNEILIEVGGYIGMSTIRDYLSRRETSTIYVFEADVNNYEILKMNVNINRFENIHIFNNMIGSESRIEIFYSQKDMFHSAVKSNLKHNEAFKKVEKEMISIDDFCKNRGISSIDRLTLTVNGYEAEVLRGAREIIKQSPNVMVVAAGWYFNNATRVSQLLAEELIYQDLDVFIGLNHRVLGAKNVFKSHLWN